MDRHPMPVSGKDSDGFGADTFVKVTFEEARSHTNDDGELESEAYKGWMKKATGVFSRPQVTGADLLKTLYPNHTLVMSEDYNLNILGFPGAQHIPLKPNEMITNVMFIPLARRLGSIPGILADAVEFGRFRTAWEKYEFTTYLVKYWEGYRDKVQVYILHDGPENPMRDLLVAAGAWSSELHDEIWVFNSGLWHKDHKLWSEIQKGNWDDVILDDAFKEEIQDDVTGFFESEELYKELAIPWKRGIIMHGPPGNGKTISLKAIMKTIQAEGRNPLYVKSFKSWRGEEGSMQEVFDKARQFAPCVLILEDLDSLINEGNRSFFLNQLDGIEGNDGLLLIGTTNHLDILDPGLSSRPSRFDRKYKFDDPTRDERVLYTKYWQKKLADNHKIDFPDSLTLEIADLTYGFSFAFLKECFISALVLMLSKKNKMTFEELLRSQIKKLRKQLDPVKPSLNNVVRFGQVTPIREGALPPKPSTWETARMRVPAAFGANSSDRSRLYIS